MRLSETQLDALRLAERWGRIRANGNRGRTVRSLAKAGLLFRPADQSCLGDDHELTESGRAALQSSKEG